jgi:hypothetical protein
MEVELTRLELTEVHRCECAHANCRPAHPQEDDFCTRPARFDLRLRGDEMVAHLCRLCAANWIAEGDWYGDCECGGCTASHHQANKPAPATSILFRSVRNQDEFELVCPSCANQRSSPTTRSRQVVRLMERGNG